MSVCDGLIGFNPLAKAERYMERRDPDVYQRMAESKSR